MSCKNQYLCHTTPVTIYKKPTIYYKSHSFFMRVFMRFFMRNRGEAKIKLYHFL